MQPKPIISALQKTLAFLSSINWKATSQNLTTDNDIMTGTISDESAKDAVNAVKIINTIKNKYVLVSVSFILKN